MLCGINWGCLSFLILFPVGILIWAKGEMRRRAALPPDDLKKLEAEEAFGPIDEKLECIFCHSKNCVRTRAIIEHIGSPAQIFSEDNLKRTRWCLNPNRRVARMISREMTRTAEYMKAHCMNCNNSWQMFAPEEKSNQ